MQVKALIRHCYHESRPVVYYKQAGKFYKMIAPNLVQPISYFSANQMIKSWKNKADAVLMDEQVLFNGKPIDLPGESFSVHHKTVNY